MSFPLLDAVLGRLEAARGNWPAVAMGSHVPLSTIRKIAQRNIKNPGVKHVEALAAYFGIGYSPERRQEQSASGTPVAGRPPPAA